MIIRRLTEATDRPEALTVPLSLITRCPPTTPLAQVNVYFYDVSTPPLTLQSSWEEIGKLPAKTD